MRPRAAQAIHPGRTPSSCKAESESFSKLTKEEQRVLDEFVGFLRSNE